MMQVKFNSHSIKDTFKKLFLNNVWNNKIIVWKLHSSVVEKSHYLAFFFDGYFFFFFFFLGFFFFFFFFERIFHFDSVSFIEQVFKIFTIRAKCTKKIFEVCFFRYLIKITVFYVTIFQKNQ